MKRLTQSIVFMIALCTLAHSAAGDAMNNLLINPSFESGRRTDEIDMWQGEGDNEFREQADVFGYTLGQGSFPDGRHALKVFSGDADLWQEGLPARPEVDYFVKAMFYHSSKQDEIEPTELSLRAFLCVEWFDDQGTLIRTDYTPNHNGTDPADEWVAIATTFKSPPLAAKANVRIQTDIDDGGGSIFIDAVEFWSK